MYDDVNIITIVWKMFVFSGISFVTKFHTVCRANGVNIFLIGLTVRTLTNFQISYY